MKTGEITIVTGWGKVTNNATVNRQNYMKYSAGSRTLQKVDLPIVDIEKCLVQYPSMNNETQLCAGGEKGKSN